jgi:hypothetical protein
MHVAPSDFVALTRGGTLCDAKDRLGAAEFELAIREQIRLYAQAENDILMLQSPCARLAHPQVEHHLDLSHFSHINIGLNLMKASIFLCIHKDCMSRAGPAASGSEQFI